MLSPLFALLPALAPAPLPQATPPRLGDQYGFLEIENPTPQAGDNFGATTAILDFDGDGVPDLAVGAPGEDAERGAVYLFRGPALDTPIRVVPWDPLPGDRFGSYLRGAALNTGAGDELIVGAERKSIGALGDAGAVYVFSTTEAPAQLFSPTIQDFGLFGCAVQVGDFDANGVVELLVAARVEALAPGSPTAGMLHAFERTGNGPWTATYSIPCPDQVAGAGLSDLASFGAHLVSLAEPGGRLRGVFVTRLGAVVQPNPGRGAVDFFRVPLGPGAVPERTFENPIALEDQDGNYRWGMYLHAQPDGPLGYRLSICHNRQDRQRADGSFAITAGSATVFDVQANAVLSTRVHGSMDDGTEFVDADHFGFRTQFVDLAGGPERELVHFALGTPPLTRPRLYLYRRAFPQATPQVIELPSRASHHAANGMSSGELLPGIGKHELVLGDPFHGPNSANGEGRVLVLHQL